jgi:hypothetical protein
LTPPQAVLRESTVSITRIIALVAIVAGLVVELFSRQLDAANLAERMNTKLFGGLLMLVGMIVYVIARYREDQPFR